ncbi:MAG TPA: hypothetical protein PK291_10600, partial [Thermotogota bacterium]|nr:hypothetical protein [Thermotogota bacterium]
FLQTKRKGTIKEGVCPTKDRALQPSSTPTICDPIVGRSISSTQKKALQESGSPSLTRIVGFYYLYLPKCQ